MITVVNVDALVEDIESDGVVEDSDSDGMVQTERYACHCFVPGPVVNCL